MFFSFREDFQVPCSYDRALFLTPLLGGNTVDTVSTNSQGLNLVVPPGPELQQLIWETHFSTMENKKKHYPPGD